MTGERPVLSFKNKKSKIVMKLFFLAIITLLLLAFTRQPPKQKIVFFGDSITQAGAGPKGYISVIGETLKQKDLQDQYELIGAGISGNKITNLFLRLEKDVLEKNPT